MRRPVPIGWLIGSLVAASAVFFAIDSFAFADMHESLAFYTLLDLAFIPLNVLIVGLFINGLLASREREELLHKMNIVIGAFFAQTGSELIARISEFHTTIDEDRAHMVFDGSWTARDFESHRRAVMGEHHAMDLDAGDLTALRDDLAGQRSFVLGLLQNGNLLEHASFTDMLWAVSHLSEELTARGDLSDIPEADRAHLRLDMARAYGRLLGEWLLYARHLRDHYPYLFSFTVRTNPFDANAKVEVGP